MRLWTAVNPAVGDVQRLRDFRPEGGAGAPKRAHPRDRSARDKRPGRDADNDKPLRILAIETTKPERLCPGVVR